MHARGCQVALSILVATTLAHADDPKPAPVDIKPFKAKLEIYTDAKGGTYAVLPKEDGQDPMLFYGTGKTLYQQPITGYGADGSSWTINTWAPRIAEMRPGSFARLKDGTTERQCDGHDDAKLTQLTGDKAKAVLDKDQFVGVATTRRPYLLARDDHGVYYYVDALHTGDYLDQHGHGHRVFVGKKGAMKQVPLLDMASDSAGDVFATKAGDLRLVKTKENDEARVKTAWVKGEKRTELIYLDTYINSRLIFSELGVYTFLGTLCDNN